jgi:hypothetical protein
MTNKIAEYIKLAEAATDGPWYDHCQRIGSNKNPSCFVMISQTYGLFASEPHGVCLEEGESVINLGTENVWPENEGKRWPAEENAKFIAASRTLGPAMAKALIEAEDVLINAEEYFDNIADADIDQDGYVPNKEMRLLIEVREALSTIQKLKENQ